MNVSGEWENQNGSVLVLEDDDAGPITGWFVSTKGRAARDQRFAVHGIRSGELVSIAVSFASEQDDLASITTFCCRWARARTGDQQLHSMWVLARAFEDEARTKPTQPWNTFLVNADVSTKISD